MKHVWTAEEVREVAREEGIDVSDCTLGTDLRVPTPISREQIVEGLRMLSFVPIDTTADIACKTKWLWGRPRASNTIKAR